MYTTSGKFIEDSLSYTVDKSVDKLLNTLRFLRLRKQFMLSSHVTQIKEELGNWKELLK